MAAALAIYLAVSALGLASQWTAHAQIKTHPNVHYRGNATDQYNHTYALYGGRFVPAETYQGAAQFGEQQHPHNNDAWSEPAGTAARPVTLDATADFINKTRSSMASGVCHKEVPTATLSHHGGDIPVGNGTTPDMSRIQVCCEGYERNAHVYRRCDPICEDGCRNGICTAPNTCICMPGHVRYEHQCISTCPLGCGNGVCDALGECQCKTGYELEPVHRQYCMPHCEGGCKFGKCVAPNQCECFDNYRLTASGACEAKCDGCLNGQCTAPGFCSCNPGYLKMGDTCEPVCEKGCGKGRCMAPNTCVCDKGYELDSTGTNCVPHCTLPCLNGACVGDDTCECNTGYIPDDHQKNICQPHCQQGCPNGYCTSPNFCVCKPGFIKSGVKGRQVCVQA